MIEPPPIHPDREPPARQADRPPAVLSFPAIVSALFVLIIALVAILWWRERSARLAAQSDAAVLLRRLEAQNGLRDVLSRLAGGRNVDALVVPLGADEVVSERRGRLDGRGYPVREITAEAGAAWALSRGK